MLDSHDEINVGYQAVTLCIILEYFGFLNMSEHILIRKQMILIKLYVN